MLIRIRTVCEKFEAGLDSGYVYGEIQRQKNLSVYVELGKVEKYIPSSTDDFKTEYKLFRKCNIFVSEINKQLNSEEYIFYSLDVTIIYC